MRNAIWFLVHLVLVLVGFIGAGSTLLASAIGPDLAVGASASLIAAGVTGFSVLFHNYVSDQRETIKNILYDSGLRAVFRGRSVLIKEQYSSRLEKAVNIDIIGFGLSVFREDYSEKFSSMGALKKVRILLLHPDFPNPDSSYAGQRDREERNPIGTIKSDISAFIAESARARRDHPQSFEVRLMTCLPSINLFRFDNEILWGPYLVGEQSRNMPRAISCSTG